MKLIRLQPCSMMSLETACRFDAFLRQGFLLGCRGHISLMRLLVDMLEMKRYEC